MYAEARSSRALAQHVSGERLLSFESFRTSLPFYLGDTVPLMSRSARALTSNYMLAKPLEALRPELVAPATLPDLLASENPPLLLTNRTTAARLRKLSPRPLTTVYTDRVSIVLRPTS